MYFCIFQPDHTLKLCLKFNRSQPIYARVGNTAGKTGRIAFFEIRAGKPGKRYLFIASRLEKLEKHFSQFLRICYIGYFVYTRETQGMNSLNFYI